MASLRPMARFVAPRARFAPSRIARVQPTRFASTTEQQVPTEQASEEVNLQPGEDVNMNGNYPDPSLTSALPLKRQFRDPYADWWDPQERRNYGEPVHEDNDILGIFSPEVYTHFTPGWGGVLLGSFVGAVGVLMAVVYKYYPDRPSVTRHFEGGLEAELGGPKAARARSSEDDHAPLDRSSV